MKDYVKLIAFSLLFVFLAVTQVYADSSDVQYMEGELLVKFKPGVRGLARSDSHRKAGATTIKEFPSLGIHHVSFSKGRRAEDVIAVYTRNPNVEYAEPNYIVSVDTIPNDFSFNLLWGLHNTGFTGGIPDADIDAPEAWDITVGLSNTVVAIIDTGIDYTHQDLDQNIWINQIELYGTAGVDDDANGYIDDIYGIDTYNLDSDPYDDHSHGTHVAGTIGAESNNSIGVTGVNWDVQLLACKFLDATGYGPSSGAIECLEYIRALKDGGVNIIASNNSWGSYSFSQALEDAIEAQGDILFIASAGNNGSDNEQIPHYPDSYYLPNIISVTTTNHSDGQVYNYGEHSVHLGAPGYDILSTMPGSVYGYKSGTSMATPHVTGVAALLKAQDPGRDWKVIKNLLLSGGDAITSLENKTISGKRLNAYGSMNCIDSPVFSALKYPDVPEIGVPSTLSALSINCDAPVGPVTVTVPGGGVVDLYDDGIVPDLAMNDGVFSGTWIPSDVNGRIVFSSSTGTETVTYLAITTSLLSEARPGQFYSETLEAVMGDEPFSWSLYSGSLPDGLSLDSVTGVISGNPTTLGTNLFSVQVTDAQGATDIMSLTIDVTDNPVFAEIIKTYDSLRSDYGRAIDVDSAGNMYVAGEVYNGNDFDWLTFKYDASGNIIWSRKFDSGTHDSPYGIAIDENDYIYVSGGDTIIKYDPSGNEVWTRNRGVITGFFDIKADKNGYIYLAGTTSSNYLISKYDTSGNLMWERTHDFGAHDQAYGVAVDGSGNVYATGYAYPGNEKNIYTVKYNSAGTFLWSQSYDNGWGEGAVGAVADADGNLYIAGHSGTYPFFYDEALIIKYDTSGNFIWSRYYSLGSANKFYDVALDGSGYPVATGYSRNANDDVITIKYDPDGNTVWTRTSDFSYSASGSGIAIGENDTTYVTGTYTRWTNRDLLLVKYTVSLGITTASLPGAEIGIPYSQSLVANGGTQPYSWAVINGTLPDGLSLNSATGDISGNPTTTGVFNFTAQVTDSVFDTVSRPLSISVYDQVVITTTSLSDGEVGTSYMDTLTATGGAPPYSWSIISGTLPDGLALNGSTGEISGVPVSAGTFNFTTLVTDGASGTDTEPLSITITDILKITTSSLPDGEPGTPYSQTLTAANGQLPYTWSIINGTLPQGLIMNGVTGDIAGIPATTGTSNFTVQVMDAVSDTALKSLSISVYDPLVITTSSLPDGEPGTPYSETLTAVGGETPYSWGIISGTLPQGLIINGISGDIYGTPTNTGTFTFQVQVTDAGLRTDISELSINVYDPLVITTTSLREGEVGLDYDDMLTATGGSWFYTWTIINGTLPDGLTLFMNSGEILGTPTTTGTSNFTLQLTDDVLNTASIDLSITVTDPIVMTTTSLSDGEVGSFYIDTLAVTGGVPPYSWSMINGTLPDGLYLDSVTGEISGTPLIAGTFNFEILVEDSALYNDFKPLSITIADAPVITTFLLSSGEVGTPYSEILTATGGELPYTWSIILDTLPDGLILNSVTGEISGTPTAAGLFDFVVEVTDATSRTDTTSLSIGVSDPLVINTPSLLDGEIGSFYIDTLAATGGVPPYSWSIINGTLPEVLFLDSVTGEIYGVPMSAGTFNFTILVEDSALYNDYKPLSITIADVLLINPSPPFDGETGTSYSQTLTALGGQLPYTWSIVNGTLPDGLTLNSVTGEISGTPTTVGTSNFTAQVADAGVLTATESFSISIYDPLVITTATLSDGETGTSYSQTLTATGGLTPYTWSISYGTLPDGLSLNSGTGEISGTPTIAGTSSFTVEVTDDGYRMDTRSLSISVYDPLVITTTSLPDGETGTSYSQTLNASGGKTPYTWSIVNGTIPDGLTLDGATGTISGAPTTVGTSVFIVEVTDAGLRLDTKALSISVYDPLMITTSSFADGDSGIPYSQTLTATGGLTPYGWGIINGTLPQGLIMNGITGDISGTPTTAGTSNFTVQVTDAGLRTDTEPLSISVYDPLVITTATLPDGEVDAAYSQTLVASGGKTPYVWSVTAGALPDGLSLDGATGAISGTPTTVGTSVFIVEVTDAGLRMDTESLSIYVYDPLVITTTSLLDGEPGIPYNETLAAVGGLTPYSWGIINGTLPQGLIMNGVTGDIFGTPTTAGTSNFTVQVTDARVVTDTRLLNISVYDSLVITTATLPDGEVDAAYSQTLVASGGKTPYVWSVTAGALPDGLSLNGATGIISGTPTTAGVFDFAAGVTDAKLDIASKDISITVVKTTTYSILTESNCASATYSRGPRYAPMGTVGSDCATEDVIRWGFKGSNKVLVGYLPSGYPVDTEVRGTSIGTNLSFLVSGSNAHVYVKLAEVNPVDGSIIREMSVTQRDPIANTLLEVTDISSLSITVSAGNALGIVLVAWTPSRMDVEMRWGKQGGGPGLEQWFTVTELPLGSAPPPTNNPPIAEANGPYSGAVDTPVLFSSSGSNDPDGDDITYLWDFGDGQTSTEANPSHTYASANTYTVTLTVTDPSDAQDTDTTSATITVGSNQPPVADAGLDQAGMVRQDLSFDGSGSYDPDGSITEYSWDFGDGKTGSGMTVSHNYKKEGTYTVTLTVTDNQGATAQDTAIVTVTK
jgi:subtilisin family serine protease/chitodextrinase